MRIRSYAPQRILSSLVVAGCRRSPAVFEHLENRVQLELLGDRAPPKLHQPDNFITFVSSLLVRTKHRTNAHVTIGNNPDAVTIASVRYHFMNAQDQARVDRDSEKVFTIENDILSPRQQIRLHFRCLVRGHNAFGKLGWHLKMPELRAL